MECKKEKEHPQLAAVLDALPNIVNRLYHDEWVKSSMGRYGQL